MDAIDVIISRLSPVEREFYQECADRVSETLEQWIAHMNEV